MGIIKDEIKIIDKNSIIRNKTSIEIDRSQGNNIKIKINKIVIMVVIIIKILVEV